MSKLVAFAAIQGGYNVVSEVEGELRNALAAYDADTKVGFPNTGYYLPVIYSLTGMKVETLEDLLKPMEYARSLPAPWGREKVYYSTVWTSTPRERRSAPRGRTEAVNIPGRWNSKLLKAPGSNS